MCLIYRDIKHFHVTNAKDFRQLRKVSSIMWAKVLSIMPPDGWAVTAG
jgi:hypothetical protein